MTGFRVRRWVWVLGAGVVAAVGIWLLGQLGGGRGPSDGPGEAGGGAPARAATDDQRSLGRGQRRALLVGNVAYRTRALVNAVNDATDLGAVLTGLGFTATVVPDKPRQELERAVERFVETVGPGDVALFYYSGHGFELGGENYVMPVDFQAADRVEAKYQGYSVNRVQERLEGRGARLVLVWLDACRDSPFADKGPEAGGWTAMTAGAGTYIAFATAPRKTASDNPRGRNGLFTGALLAALGEEGLTLDEVFARVGAAVQDASGGKQVPWVGQVPGTGRFVLRPGPAPGPALPEGELARREEVALWESVRESRSVALLEEYLRQYPAGKYRVIAEARIGELRGGGTAPAPAPSGRRSGEAAGALELSGATPLAFVWIAPGRFAMGSTTWEADERPVRQVTVTRGFELGATEVTQGQWTAVMGRNPSSFTSCGPTCPVENVSWDDVQGFIEQLNGRRDGYRYRLPTEAEWEYAARAGTTGEYAGDLDALGWYDGNAGGTTHPVGSKAPNGWGLHDMHGNVWEWVADWYAESYGGAGAVTDPRGPTRGAVRVLRGGSWLYAARYCRSADRFRLGPGSRRNNLGFRLLRVRSS